MANELLDQHLSLWKELLTTSDEHIYFLLESDVNLGILSDTSHRNLVYEVTQFITPFFSDDIYRIQDGCVWMTSTADLQSFAIQSFSLFRFLKFVCTTLEEMAAEYECYFPLVCFFLQRGNWTVNAGNGTCSILCDTVLGECIPIQFSISVYKGSDGSGNLFFKVKVFDSILEYAQFSDICSQLIPAITKEEARLFLHNDLYLPTNNGSVEQTNSILKRMLDILSVYSPEESFSIPDTVYDSHLNYNMDSLNNGILLDDDIKNVFTYRGCVTGDMVVPIDADTVFYMIMDNATFHCRIDQTAVRHLYLHQNGNYQYYIRSFDMNSFIGKLSEADHDSENEPQRRFILDYTQSFGQDIGNSWSIGIHASYVFVTNETFNNISPSKIFTLIFDLDRESNECTVNIRTSAESKLKSMYLQIASLLK